MRSQITALFLASIAASPAVALPFPAQGFGAGSAITSGALQSPWCIESSDVDLDGDPDLIIAERGAGIISWYANDGAGVFGAPSLIDPAAPGAFSIFPADLDADGDDDLLAALSANDSIVWYENVGGSFATARVLPGAMDGARSVFAADIDGDGDLDAVAGSFNDDQVAWFENLGSGSFGTLQPITNSADFVLCTHAADVDGDGDVDVVTASRDDDQIRVFENIDGLGGSWVAHSVLTVDGPSFVSTGDLDADGDLDLVCTSVNENILAWIPNEGGGLNFGPRRILADNLERASGLAVSDLNQDGLLDVAACCYGSDVSLNLPADGRITWYRSLGGGAFGAGEDLAAGLDRPSFIHCVDLDSDGMPELTGAIWRGGSAIVFSNLMLPPGALVEPGMSLQAAIDVASPGDVILVAPGTYNEAIDLRGMLIELRSIAGPERTTITGAGTGTTVINAEGTPPGTRVTGFTLTEGAGRPFPSSFGSDYYGGGVWAGSGAQLEVEDCIIVNNAWGTGTFAGGVYSGSNSHVSLRRCIIADNRAWASGGATLCDYSGTMLIEHCTVYGNSSNNFFGQQGGISLANNGDAVVRNSIVWGNEGAELGAFAPPYNSGTQMDVEYSDIEGGYAGPSNNIQAGTAGPGIINAAPQFADPASYDFRLLGGSTCIDAGSPAATPDCDGSLPDLGALGPACEGIGWSYCSPALPNSAGLSGEARAYGSSQIDSNDMTLQAHSIPLGSFGFFILSETTVPPTVAGGSSGQICLGGSIGRFIAPGEVLAAGLSGVISLAIDPAALPTPSGPISANPGETWFFQLWHRDAIGGQTTSNFTDAVAVTFQ